MVVYHIVRRGSREHIASFFDPNHAAFFLYYIEDSLWNYDFQVECL